MTNGEKFRNPDERLAAFMKFCESCTQCDKCKISKYSETGACKYAWLDLEYEEELKECPFCGAEARIVIRAGNHYQAECKECFCKTTFYINQKDAVEAWNRRV